MESILPESMLFRETLKLRSREKSALHFPVLQRHGRLPSLKKIFSGIACQSVLRGRIIYSADKIPAAAEVAIQRLSILKLLQFSFKIFLSLIKIC